MKMKLFITSFALASLFISSANAQKSSAIIKGGLNLANVSVNDDGDIDDAKTLASFQVGILGDFYLAPFLAIQPGLIFTGKGSKTQRGSEGSANFYRATSNPYYLEVPVNLVFKTPTGPVKFFAGAGPYIAIGIAGKNKTHGETALGITYNSEETIDWSNDDPTTLDTEEDTGFGIMRRFDYGLNGLVGIETSNIVISANFGLGLAKLQSGTNSEDNNNNKHRVVSFTLGFRL
jgi:Outer membrane protein beta-barrel domain